jgi:hypothetical protein
MCKLESEVITITAIKINNKEYILNYNFSALKIIENNGIELTNMSKVKMSDLAIIFYAGIKKMHRDIKLENVDNILDDLVEEKGLEKGLEYLSNIIGEAMSTEKK